MPGLCARQNGAIAASPVLLVMLAGCGYVGEPLTPALKRPAPVTDLNAVEHGPKIYVHFSVPRLTTEGLKIPGQPDIELRIGPVPGEGSDPHEWERTADRVPVSAIQVSNGVAGAELDASKFYGKTVQIGVRVHGPHGRDIGWSRFETLSVVPALPRPEDLAAKDAPDAVQLDWRAAAPEFRLFRKEQAAPDWSQIGTTPKPAYTDNTIEYGKTYQYFVQSIEKAGEKYAESENSATIEFKPTDRFPPAVPADLTAVPGARTIELVWERNTEKDFASYRVYRDGQRIAEGLGSPSFSDKDVKPGVKYRYQISAVDASNNESALSAAVEGAIP
jgi:hypothetical protein